ncbi:hypothetical protein HYY73_00055 [Candidatus Woesearchaeota archaeon]|nr:hypothetical protein [Candidatus Woesearchaeota archaeon]
MKLLEQVLSEFDPRKDVSRAKDIIDRSWNKGIELFLSISPIPAAYTAAFLPAAYMFWKGGLRGGSVGAAAGAVIAYALGNDVATGAAAGARYGVVADVGQQVVRGLVSVIRESRAETHNHYLM